MPITLIINYYVTSQNYKLLSNHDLLIDRENRKYLSISINFLSTFCKLSKKYLNLFPRVKKNKPNSLSRIEVQIHLLFLTKDVCPFSPGSLENEIRDSFH